MAGSSSRAPGRPPRSPEARAAQRSRLLDGAMAAIRRHGPEVSVDEMATGTERLCANAGWAKSGASRDRRRMLSRIVGSFCFRLGHCVPDRGIGKIADGELPDDNCWGMIAEFG